jgi:two-component system sensor histidine kinase/response regulator
METPTILVIDDDEAMRESCCRIFGKTEYRVSTAGDGATGLERVRQIKPDIAFVDLKMPDISGMEVIEGIRNIDPTIVSIMITGYPSTEAAVQAMRLGAYDFLPKPFTPQELRAITQTGLQTRRQALQSAAVQRRKEETKELLISIVSHQLRSPLTAVQAYLDLILGDFATEPDEQQRILKQANKRIQSLLEMINDWLKMAEIDGVGLEKKFESLNLAAILLETVDFMQPLAKAKELTLRLELSHDLLPVRGDKQILREVFTNLIDNGIKYNRGGGEVTVTARENGERLLIDVADTGIGISETDIPFVFDEFFRAKSEETREIAGTGLGLAIVKRMVEAHSGSIDVTSHPGKGSVFTVTLPRPHTSDGGSPKKEGGKWKR